MNHHSALTISADNFPIYVALAAALVACGSYLVAAVKARRGSEQAFSRVGRIAYYVSAACVSYALIYLLQCILSGSRFDIAYVSNYSSLRDAFVYRVSALWAGQGGSLLLWATMSGAVGLFLIRGQRWGSPAHLAFWCAVQAFFLTLLIVDDPMRQLVDFQPGSMGGGMNPLLKNPWMVVHPPVVFAAYALLAVPAALAIQALIDGDASQWVKRCFPWAVGAWIAMTAGLVLGMVWSYEVLGWGGYWGWDPVENASLVQWLLITALMHGLVLQRQRGRMARWNLVLALAVFLSVLYGTFLTRSGVLSEISVHTFGGAENFRATPFFKWLKWFPIGLAVLCGWLLAVRWKLISGHERRSLAPMSRDLALGAGIAALCLFAVVVLVGTTYSTFSAKAGLQPGFYTTMSIPLGLAILILIVLSPLVAWAEGASSKGRLALRNASIALGAVLVLAPILARVGPMGGRPPQAVAASLTLVGSALIALVISLVAGGRSSLRVCGAHVAHAGVALVVIGIVFSTTGSESIVDLKLGGQPAPAQGYSFVYTGRHRLSHEADVLHVTMEGRGQRWTLPLRIAGSDRGTIMFPAIRSSLLRDVYIAPDKILSDTVTPHLSWDGKSWVSHPVRIPGSKDAVALVGMQVEAQRVLLQYLKPGFEPKEFRLDEHHPATVEGYTFAFRGFTSDGKNMMSSAGANIGVSGRGLAETLVLRVSTKPLISLLWLGTILIVTGGCLALNNRRSAK